MRTLILLMLSTLLACALNAQTVRIMPLGNSITQGDNNHYSYRYNLWSKLNSSGLGVVFDFVGSVNTNFNGSPAFPNPSFDRDHEGHWGWRADQLLGSLPGWLINYTPDIALVHVGSNDAFGGQSTSSTVAEIEQIINVLRADNANVTILLAKLIPVNAVANPNINALNAEIPGIVSRKNTAASRVILVDQNTGFNAVTDTYDLVHPNSIGEEKMAKKWYDAIMALDRFAGGNTNTPHVISLDLTTNEEVDLVMTPSVFAAAYSDVDGDQVKTVKILTLPAKGQLSVDGSNVAAGRILSLAEFSRMQISPKSNMNGPTSFEIESTDQRNLAVTHEVKVNIVPVNDPPTFGPFEITEKDFKVIYLQGQVIDVDHPISSLIFNVSSNNQAVVADGDLSFTIVGDKIVIKVGAFTEGVATLKITAYDGTHTATGYATINITNTPHTMDLTFETNEDETLIFRTSTFMEAFEDVDGDYLQAIKIVKLPLNGTLVLDGTNVSIGTVINADKIDKLRFVPKSNVSGATSFTFESIDGRGLAVSHEVKVNIVPVNDPPALGPFEITKKDSKVIYLQGQVIDVDHPISSLIFNVSSNNQVVVADGDLSFTIVGDKIVIKVGAFTEGVATLKITAYDGTHTATGYATINITNTPHTMDLAFETNEDETLIFQRSKFVEAFEDVDGDYLQAIKILKLPLKGTLVLDGTNVIIGTLINADKIDKLSFVPNSNVSGETSFTFESIDGRSLAVSHEVKANIVPVNDPPTLGPFEITKKDSKVIYLEGQVIDVDHPISSLVFKVSSNKQAVVADKDLSFSIVGDKIEIKVGAFTEGVATLKITAHDGTHTATGYATITITNTPHTMDLAFETNEDETLIFHTSTFMEAFEDVDGDHLQAIKIVKLPLKGTVVLDGTIVTVGTRINADKIDKLSFVPDSNISGETSFTFESIDGRDLAIEVISVIVIKAVNDSPELEAIEDREINLETIHDVTTVPLVISDVDTPASSLTLVAISDNQTAVADKDLSIHNSILSIKTSAIGVAKITVTISDGQNQFSQQFTVMINLITDVESEISRKFQIFPNPADDYIFISLPENSSPKMEYYIVDARGVLVGESKSSELEDENLLRININGLQSGLYLINCLLPGGYEKSVKFFKK